MKKDKRENKEAEVSLESILSDISTRRDMEAAKFAESIKGKTKEEICEITASVKPSTSGRTVEELLTSPTIKNRGIWFGIREADLFDRVNLDVLGLKAENVLGMTVSAIKGLVAEKAGLTIHTSENGRGFVPISKRSAADLAKAMTVEQKAELLKQLMAETESKPEEPVEAE